MSDEEDILGGGSPLPTSRAERRKRNIEAAGAVFEATGPVSSGVSVFWLSKAFGLDVVTVRKKIADCPPKVRRAGGYLYDLRTVAPYLVQPKGSLQDALETMRPSDLPERLREAYWSARLKQQKWEETAKELWHTEDVMAAFAAIFQAVKFSVQLWPDQVERAAGLTEAQREMMVAMADELQTQIHREVLEAAEKQTAPSNYAKLEAVLVVAGPEAGEEDEDIL